MAKYNFSRLDIMNERDEKEKEDIRVKMGSSDVYARMVSPEKQPRYLTTRITSDMIPQTKPFKI
jgi:hypothetical protein